MSEKKIKIVIKVIAVIIEYTIKAIDYYNADEAERTVMIVKEVEKLIDIISKMKPLSEDNSVAGTDLMVHIIYTEYRCNYVSVEVRVPAEHARSALFFNLNKFVFLLFFYLYTISVYRHRNIKG